MIVVSSSPARAEERPGTIELRDRFGATDRVHFFFPRSTSFNEAEYRVYAAALAARLPVRGIYQEEAAAREVVLVTQEYRADRYAAAAVGATPMMRALEKLADLNMMKRNTGHTWNLMRQHPGIHERLEPSGVRCDRCPRAGRSPDERKRRP